MNGINDSKVHKAYGIGVFALILSALLTAVSQVFYANKVQAVHPFLFTGFSFFFTAAFFYLISRKQIKSRNWHNNWHSVVKLNTASIMAFMGFYYALKFIEPAIVSSLEIGLAPLYVLLLSLFTKEEITKKQWLIAVCTIIACVILGLSIFTGQSGVVDVTNKDLFWGVLASVLCGLGAVLCTIYSKELNKSGWTSSMILTHRFYGIILVSFLFTYELISDYLLQHITWIVIVTLFGVTLPMFLLQKGIQHCETFSVMMSICFIPVFTFFFQLFDPRIEWSMTTFFGVLVLLLLGILSMTDEKQT